MQASDRTLRTAFVIIAFALFSALFLGLIYLSTVQITETEGISYLTWILIAYAAGLSMIVLPCTLPLVFIIVPMATTKGYKRGLGMGVLFGLGLTITIALYGVAISLAGRTLGLDQATLIMFFVAGLAAYIFGLSELGLIRFKMPAYRKTPKFFQERGDYVKSLLMGLLLGNAGVGCPNPLFYLLLIYIAGTGSAITGVSVGFVHGIGRAIPLILLVVLAILGVNATGVLVKRRVSIQKVTAWALVLLGAFLIINGLPGGHEWYEATFVHQGWNRIVEAIGLPGELEMDVHEHAAQSFGIGAFAPWLFLALALFPIIWYKFAKRKGGDIDG